MRILERYIATAVLTSGLLVMTVLLALFFFVTYVGEVADVGKHHYSHWVILHYCLLLIPRNIHELFPMVTLLGTILGLGMLASSGELTAVRAAGVSIGRIGLSLVKISLLFIVLNLLVGELLAPQWEMQAKALRAVALGKRVAVTNEGIWVREQRDFIQIERLLANGDLSGLLVFRLNEEGKLATIIEATHARFIDPQWQLREVRLTHFNRTQVVVEELPEMLAHSELRPALLGMVKLAPEHLSLQALLDYIGFMQQNQLDARAYELSFWKRVLSPLTIIGMLLLATPFVFGSLREVSIGQRIMVGSLVGIGFYLFSGIFSQFVLIYQIPPFISAIAPLLLIFMLWSLLIRRVV
ncbi:MAG: LPS export ABC transporter permease LptG [Gammaproteobacteria bacterium]|nr:LPS export ABC transporter permease LptG [Gammaproteobacteria bacterium]